MAALGKEREDYIWNISKEETNSLGYYSLIKENIQNAAHECKNKIWKHSQNYFISVYPPWENEKVHFLLFIPYGYPILNTLFQSLPMYYLCWSSQLNYEVGLLTSFYRWENWSPMFKCIVQDHMTKTQ